MKPIAKNILWLIFLEVLVLLIGLMLVVTIKEYSGLTGFALLSFAFTVITAVSLIIFFRGQGRDPGSQTFHSLISISFKFLLELILALAWFFIAKKTGIPSVILFFVLYLTFTLFLVLMVLKSLKNRSL